MKASWDICKNIILHEDIISFASFNFCCEFKLAIEIKTRKLNLGTEIRKKLKLTAIKIRIRGNI